MSKELDTSWFDLKKYDGLKKLDLNGWYIQIYNRLLLKSDFYFSITGEQPETLLHRLKENPIIACDRDMLGKNNFNHKYNFNTPAVRSTTAFEFWSCIDNQDLDDVWKKCKVARETLCFPSDTEDSLYAPLDFLNKISYEGYFTNISHITVDLSAPDEQIISNFKYWLNEYRKAVNYKSSKKIFSDKDFSEWIEYRLLPYIDLKIISEIEQKEITQAKAARLIFSDEYDADITERLRRTTKPKADWLFRNSILDSMRVQSE